MKKHTSFPAVLAVPLLLSACATAGPAAGACPETGFMADADAAPFFAQEAKTQEPSNVNVYAVLKHLRGDCTTGKADADVDFSFDVIAQKTPLGQGITQQNLSYFIAVMNKDDDILQRQRFYVTVDFGKTDSGMQTVEHRVKIPAGDVAQDRVVVGFTLTPEQAKFNKAYPHDLDKNVPPGKR